MRRRVLSLVLAGALCLGLSSPALAAGLENFQRGKTYTAGQFTDVPADSWFAANVQAAYELGLMEGNTASTFNPSGNLTIAEALVLACRLHSTYLGDNASFTGSGGAWYQPYVDYATQNSIVAAGTYSDYTATATRAQFASILAAALPAEALTAINTVTALPDVPADAAYAPAALLLYNAGVLTGSDSAGSFQPDTTIQRSEVATIVGRMADPSLRKTFTLTAGETETPAQEEPEAQERSPMRTQEDLEGTWSAVYSDGSLYEYTFSGDHFTRVVEHEFSDYSSYQYWDGTYTMTSEPVNGNENVRKITLDLAYGGVEGSTKYGFEDMGSRSTVLELTADLTAPQDQFVWAGATFTRSEPKVLLNYQTVIDREGVAEPSTAEDFGYQGYADFPSIPDFGALYGLELQPDPSDTASSPQLEALEDIVDAYTSGMTTYYYSAWEYQEEHDTLVPPALDINFFDDYAEALEACGFRGEYRRNILGDLTFYFVSRDYLVSYGINSVADVLGYTGINANKNDDIAIYIQPNG